MERKPQIKATLPEHIRTEIVRRAQLNGTTPAEYLTAIAERWYGEGSPAVSKAEERLLREQHNERRVS